MVPSDLKSEATTWQNFTENEVCRIWLYFNKPDFLISQREITAVHILNLNLKRNKLYSYEGDIYEWIEKCTRQNETAKGLISV